jgi:hypothetical protein
VGNGRILLCAGKSTEDDLGWDAVDGVVYEVRLMVRVAVAIMLRYRLCEALL